MTMVDGVTGLRCKAADVPTLENSMKTLYDNPPMRESMGKDGRKRVLDLFSGEKIVAAWADFYKEILK